MDIEEQVFDPDADIFYNNKYLEVLNRKDIVMDLEKPPKDVKFDIQFDESAVGEYKPIRLNTVKAKIDHLDMQMKNALFRYYRIDLFKYKYLLRGNDNGLSLSFNYITRKFGKTRINNKKIFILHATINFAIISDLIEHENCLFTEFGYDIFMRAKDCTIYALIFNKNNKSYVPTLKNKLNNNTYHLINYDNDGNIIVKDNYIINYDRLKDIKVDLIYGLLNMAFSEYIYENKFKNNLFMICLYTILKCSDINSQLIIFAYQPTDMMKNAMHLLTSAYTKGRLICPKTIAPYVIFVHFQKFTGKNLFDKIIEKYIKDDVIFSKPFVNSVGKIIDNYEPFVIFKNNISTHELRMIKDQTQLLRYMFNKQFDHLSRIIKKNIEIQQKYIVHTYKYVNY